MAKAKSKAKEAAIPQSQSLDALRDKVTDALQDAFGVADPSNYCGMSSSPWIRDLFQDKVAYSLDGTLYQVSYSLAPDTGEITFGTPIEVEVAYVPTGESCRVLANESVVIESSAYNKTKGELVIKVIQPGLSKNNRFYPAEVLKRDHAIFDGMKMFADHQTDADAAARPEGSVNNWVAVLKNTWAETDGSIMGSATVIDPPFKTKLDNLAEAGLLSQMGTSIRCIAEGRPAEVDGSQVVAIERLVAGRSVDFVTYAGAGGRVVAMEARSEDGNDIDLVDVTQLRKRRPDLVSAIESHARTEAKSMTDLELKLQESHTKLAVAEKRATDAETKANEADKREKRTTASSELTRLLSESKLPKLAKERISKQFDNAETTDGMADAIKSEAEYIASFATTGVRNLGESARGGDDKVIDLTKSYQLLGLTEAEAKIAAGARR